MRSFILVDKVKLIQLSSLNKSYPFFVASQFWLIVFEFILYNANM